MNNIETIAKDIKRIDEFMKYLKYNFKTHSKQVKQSNNIDDIKNSVAFLEDYQKVTSDIIKAIEEYSKLNGIEF